MTWQGGKKGREAAPAMQFACLRPLTAGPESGLTESLQGLAEALRNYGSRVRIHIRLIDGEEVDHWEIEAGSGTTAARRGEPKGADVLVALRNETWVEIARGNLAPFDALFAGRLRVGGNLELAKDITRHLSDPAVPYVAPC